MSFTFRNAADPASQILERGLEPQILTNACNMAIQTVWRAYDWHWTLAKLPPFYLIPGKQDYGWPAVTVPSDLAAIRKAYFWDLRISQILPVSEVKVIQNLGLSQIMEYPARSICYIPAGMSPNGSGMFRIFPPSPANYVSPYVMIDGEYKKIWTYQLNSTTYTRLQNGHDVSVNFPFGDQYFDFAVEIMKWAFMAVTHHKDRGGVQVQNGSESYFGQYAVMKWALAQMMDIESGEQGNPAIAPESDLVSGGGVFNTWGF